MIIMNLQKEFRTLCRADHIHTCRYSCERCPARIRPVRSSPIVAAAALQEGVIRPGQTINSTGGIRVGNSFFPTETRWPRLTDARKSIAYPLILLLLHWGGYQI